MKKSILYISIICLALSLQGCPITCNNTTTGFAYVLSLQDTIECMQYDGLSGMEKNGLVYPSNYLTRVHWGVNPDESYPAEKNVLYLKKLTNHAECIVILGYCLYINDMLYSYDSYGYQYKMNASEDNSPYTLEDIIEQLELHYPHLVYRIHDTDTHVFDDYKVSHDKSLYPRIYIK